MAHLQERRKPLGFVTFVNDSDGRLKPTLLSRKRATCGGGAISNIVGHTKVPVGKATRANNVESGSSRESRLEQQSVSDGRPLSTRLGNTDGLFEANL